MYFSYSSNLPSKNNLFYGYLLQVTAVSFTANAQFKILVESSMRHKLHSNKKVLAPIMSKFVGQWGAKRRKFHYMDVKENLCNNASEHGFVSTENATANLMSAKLR